MKINKTFLETYFEKLDLAIKQVSKDNGGWIDVTAVRVRHKQILEEHYAGKPTRTG